jgi:Fe-S-cluster containining protein
MPFKKVFGFGPVADMLDMFDLSQADMLPVAFMEFDTEDSGRQACRFLSPDEGGKRLCSIYEHRPGMCRLHPLGCVTIGGRRKWIYRQPLCESNKGPEQTVEEWLRASRMKPFLAANARYLRWMRKLFEEREKFLSIPEDKWQMLEHILYNFDSINRGAAKTNMDAIEEKFYRWLYQALPDKT